MRLSETGMAADAFLLESEKIKKSNDHMRRKNALRIAIIASVFALFSLAAPWSARQAQQAQRDAGFEKFVRPFLAEHCTGCHNAEMKTGGLNLEAYSTVASVIQYRQRWEDVAKKIRRGEMPPKGMPRPKVAETQAIIQWIENLFEQVDQQAKPDPGRVTARRLNRNEYANTVRDLLGVDFRATQEFPVDDSGDGFDNIADVLTISPVLMEKYMNAAERIAARAVGAGPSRKKLPEFENSRRTMNLRRLNPSAVEATHRVDWDGEYVIRFGLPGERSADAKPVAMGFWMDGKLLNTIQVETKPSKLVYFDPYSEEDMRLFLPEGDHTFRAAYINDDFVKGPPLSEAHNIKDVKKDKIVSSMLFIGPFPSQTERASRKKILTCAPNSGPACVEKPCATLARRAYRRPVTKNEVASLLNLVDMSKAEGLSAEQGIQVAIQAMLVSPYFLCRIERDPDPTDP